jgi:signal peptide peptidase SppA
MNLHDVVTAPWAIQSEKLLEIRRIYEMHLAGAHADLAAVEAALGRPLQNERAGWRREGAVAVVPIVGVLSKRANMLTRISGGTSTQIAGEMLAEAAADPGVAGFLIEIDSPGGQVDGVQQLSQQVAQLRASGKPVAAWINGCGASGAYWIASAAERVFIADETTVVGSIGVVATHVDVSKREADLGVKTTEITAGKYKRIASAYAPLSSEGRATIQEQVDAIYSVFVEQVAAGRGVAVERVLRNMAEGRLFVGRAAIAAGLVDGVASFDATLAALQPDSGGWPQAKSAQSRKVSRNEFNTLPPLEQACLVRGGCEVVE